MAKHLTAIMLPPEEEEFPTKGMTPIHKKWMTSKGKLSGREKKKVSRFTGDRQYHLMERGRRAERKAKETLRDALCDMTDYEEEIRQEEIARQRAKEREIEEKRQIALDTAFDLAEEINRLEKRLAILKADLALVWKRYDSLN